MYLEYANYQIDNYDEILKDVFSAIEMGVGGISVPYPFLSGIGDYISHGMSLSCPINWPMSFNSNESVNTMIVSAANRSANAVDVNFDLLLMRNNTDKLKENIDSNMRTCEKKGVTYRVFLDYRTMSSEELSLACAILSNCGVEYVFPSNGYRLDNFLDNLIVGNSIQKKFPMFSICNGNLYRPKDAEFLNGGGVFGCRLHSINGLRLVYNTMN